MSDILEKLSLLANQAIDKGREIKDIAKINMEIKSQENLIKAYKLVIGEYVASHGLLSDDELIREQINKILKEQENIKENKEKIKALKNL